MKSTEKQSNESGKAQITLLVAVMLAAGGAGVWSQLHAAGAMATQAASYAVVAQGNNGLVDIEDNGDGTGFVFAYANSPDGSSVSGYDDANMAYSASATGKPGQSGKGTGSGMASATINGTFMAFDDMGMMIMYPIVLQVGATVDGTTDVSASSNQGITVSFDPMTGHSKIYRVNFHGDQYSGATAGSYSISVDGSAANGETGVFGLAGIFSTHSHVRIK